MTSLMCELYFHTWVKVATWCSYTGVCLSLQCTLVTRCWLELSLDARTGKVWKLSDAYRPLSPPPVLSRGPFSEQETPDWVSAQLWLPGFRPCSVPSVYFLWLCRAGVHSLLFWCLLMAHDAKTLIFSLAARARGVHVGQVRSIRVKPSRMESPRAASNWRLPSCVCGSTPAPLALCHDGTCLITFPIDFLPFPVSSPLLGPPSNKRFTLKPSKAPNLRQGAPTVFSEA